MAAPFARRGKFLLPSFGGLDLRDCATSRIRTHVICLADAGRDMEEFRYGLGRCARTSPSTDDQEDRKESDQDQDDD